MLKWFCSQMFYLKLVVEQFQLKVNEVKIFEFFLGFDDVKSFDVIREEVIYGLFVLVEVVLNVLDDY